MTLPGVKTDLEAQEKAEQFVLFGDLFAIEGRVYKGRKVAQS